MTDSSLNASAEKTRTLKVPSLKSRLVISAMVMLFVLLPAIGLTLDNAFGKHLLKAVEQELTAHSYSILAETDYIDGELLTPTNFLESQFNVIDSGLYALITELNSTVEIETLSAAQAEEQSGLIWHSDSALNITAINSLHYPPQGERTFYLVNFAGQAMFVSSFSVNFADLDQDMPVTLHIAKSQQDFMAAQKAFRQQLLVWLVIIAVVFAAIMWWWLSWTLKPLKQLTTELKTIEQGDSESVAGQYPMEVQPAINQLNNLLSNEQTQRLRYRNALANLAHSLKTPLATITSAEAVSFEVQQEVNKINQIVEHQLKRAQSAGQSAWRLSVDIKPCVEKLLAAMAKIYRDKAIATSVNIPEHAKFKGDGADLMEILGNLIDNAFKAAKSQVAVTVICRSSEVIMQIADDGVGISADERDSIMQRGVRVDTYEQGHGIGLAIVRDLVTSYQGEVHIKQDHKLGGALFELLFRTK
ncbi:GHKL domain-containing protein [Thalassotalea euphylliae]|uniref:histidine kinase n=1 Tax=Thalassotalea euphylliae TaxID=1655234 RepID=A0A3E0TNY9_9GAMM|nr:ATP-binding protein [Thalassotalea euphylliae]REL26286.1 GHKL domain-containing protein [Thalassotalea euphylliae]